MKRSVWQKLYPYFLPHPQTHQKPILLSWKFLLIYILLFVLLRSIFELVNIIQPGVLGTSSSITIQQIIEGTNRERAAKGLMPLKENPALDAAAQAKADNMIAENYWAHFSPSGKDPWGFIKSAGYSFTYAGENLARNFQISDDVVRAWMDSPTHRDNILDSRYQDIGIAVVDGDLNGQRTTLVVQMFGKPLKPVIKAEEPAAPKVAAIIPTLAPAEIKAAARVVEETPPPVEVNPPVLIAGAETGAKKALPIKPILLNPYDLTRTAGVSMVTLIALLLVLDGIVLMRRRVFRLSAHHVAHLGFLALTAASLISTKVGEIL